MNADQIHALSVLTILNGSMISRKAVLLRGRLHGREQTVWGIINKVEVESGSGLTFNVTTSDNHVLFIDTRLNGHHVVAMERS